MVIIFILLSSYRTNQFHLPIARDLFITLQQTYSAQFYGFINSDVLLSPSIFPILEELIQYHQQGTITEGV